MIRYLTIILTVCATNGQAQVDPDSVFIRKIYNEALERGEAYENLRVLCKSIGARLTGSAEAEMAIYWGKELLESYGFSKVYLQEIKVPHAGHHFPQSF